MSSFLIERFRPARRFAASGLAWAALWLGIPSILPAQSFPVGPGAAPAALASLAAPQAVSVDPPAGTWGSADYVFTFLDSAGWQSISVANILINNFVDGRNACYVAVVPSGAGAGSVYLVDDAGNSGGPYQGMVLPGSGTVQNSQCSISGKGSWISGSANTLTVKLSVTFKAAFAGNRIIYMAAREAAGANSGWQALGTCSLPGNNPAGPAVGGVAPGHSSGSDGGLFILTFTDTNGWQDLGVVNVLINDALNGNQACYLAYSRPYNTLYLVNDPGTALLPGLTLNGSGTMANSQCTITGAGSSASGSGNTLTLTLNMKFPAGFAGNRIIYMAARNNGDALNSGWQAAGTSSVYPPPKLPRVWRLDGASGPAGVGPDVIRLDSGMYRMFYTVAQGIGSSWSSDGVAWNAEPGARLESKRIDGVLNYYVSNPWTVRLADGRWRMYYQTFTSANDFSRVGSAISADGYQFVVEPGLRIDAGPSTGWSYAGHGRAWRAPNGWFWMLFSGNTVDDSGASDVALANSPDGLTWTILNPHLFIDGHDPTLLVNPDNSISALWMYLDKAFYTSDSSDGNLWSPPAQVFFQDENGQPPPANALMGDVTVMRLPNGNLRLFSNWDWGGIHSFTPFNP
jgi:hypothetical protein